VTTPSATWEAGDDPQAQARGCYSDLMVSLAGSIAQRIAGYPDKGDDDDAKNVGNFAFRLARIEAGLPMNPGLMNRTSSTPETRYTPPGSASLRGRKLRLPPCCGRTGWPSCALPAYLPSATGSPKRNSTTSSPTGNGHE
jgi:hypothetical protein